MCTVGVPEGEERKGLGKYLKILKLKTSLTWDRKHSSPGSTENAIQDKPKEAHQFTSVQSLSRVRLFATPWTAAHQASLSITNSQSLPKPMSIESVMPSNHLILCHPILLLPSIFPSIRVFSNESALYISGQRIGVSGSTSVLPMNTQDWCPLGWTGWISLQSKGLSRVFSKNHSSKASILRHSTFLIVQISYPYMTTGKTIALTIWTFVSKVMLCFLIHCLGLS